MTDPVAIWGAITGTAGLGITLRREVTTNRRSMQINHGWQYFLRKPWEGRTPQLIDVCVYVMAHNTGRRPLHIEHAGFEFLVPAPREVAEKVGCEVPPENRVWMNARVEIALNAQTFEVIPDGPSVKLWTRIGPFLALGIDPIATTMRPYVTTVPERYWWGDETVLLPHDLPLESEGQSLTELARVRDDWIAEHGPLAARTAPGEVVGVPMFLPEGDVERASDLLSAEAAMRHLGDTTDDA